VALVKDMKSGEQRPVPLDRLVQELDGLSRRR
jgi:hypothetical protein